MKPSITSTACGGWTPGIVNQGLKGEHWAVTHYCEHEDGGIADICDINPDLSPQDAERVATLIGLAPVMLATLESLVAVYDKVGGPLKVDPAVADARAILAALQS